MRLVVFERRARQLMKFLILAKLKIRPFAAFTVESSKKYILTYFQKLKSLHLLTTWDSSLGKVWGKTFFRTRNAMDRFKRNCHLIAELIFPFVPRLCSAPHNFQLLLLSPTYANDHVLQVTLYTIPFNHSLFGRSFCFLKIFPNARTSLNAVLKKSVERTPTLLLHTGWMCMPSDSPGFLVACLFVWFASWLDEALGITVSF